MESKTSAGFAPGVTLSADGFSSQGLEVSLLLRSNPLVEIAIGARLVLVQTTLDVDVAIDDGLLAGVAAGGADGVFRTLTTVDTVCVARLALTTGRRVFAVRT